MDSRNRQKKTAIPYMVMAALAIFLLEGLLLQSVLPQAETLAVKVGILALAAGLALAVGLLLWVLIRQILGHYELEMVRLNSQLSSANEKLKELSLTDDLTGLYNRRFFDDHFRLAFRQSQRSGKPLSLLLIDLDHFKRINDTYGHRCGDRVLEGVATALTDLVRRGGDLLARYGGEEFVAVLPETGHEAAAEIATKLIQQIRKTSVVENGQILRVTASVGIAGTDQGLDFPSETSLFRAADAALYAAKRSGKDRIALAPSDLPEKKEIPAKAD